MRTALIVSLNFRAAHISHLVASYRQMQDLGYESICYVHPNAVDYLPKGIKYITTLNSIKDVSVGIFWFPSLKNITKMLSLRILHGSKIIYVFHEPIEKFKSYLESGNSKVWTLKFFMKYYIGLIFLRLSDLVILPSDKAVKLYRDSICRLVNKNFHYLPLMYADERNNENIKTPRKFFSYIGGISNDHAFPEFINYIYHCYKCNIFDDLQFLIASWRKCPQDPRLAEMVQSGKLEIFDGKPMSNKEINRHYASSFAVWNAYNRSTQSGVLAKAFMFGTPGLVMKKNLSEFVVDGREVKAIVNNKDFNEISHALQDIIKSFSSYSDNARKNFERNYLYSTHNEVMNKLLDRIK